MNDKLTEEIIIGIRDIPHYLHEMEQTAAADRLIKAIHRLEVLAQQVQLLKGADEERARLRELTERTQKYLHTEFKGLHLGFLKEGLAASPTGYTESLEQALRMLYEETADYIRINHLGDVHHNASMKKAHEALGGK